MDSKEMMNEIKRRRTQGGEIKDTIKNTTSSLEEKIIASIYHMPSQAYGVFIKELVAEELASMEIKGGDGYTEEFGNYKVKVSVKDDDIARLKQVTPDEDIQTYILVHMNYIEGTLKLYALSSKVVWENITNMPDHGTVAKGFVKEFTSFIDTNTIRDYLI